MTRLNFGATLTVNDPQQVFSKAVGSNPYAFSQEINNLADAFNGINFTTRMAAADTTAQKDERMKSESNALSNHQEIKDKNGNTVGYSESSSQSFNYTYSFSTLNPNAKETASDKPKSERSLQFETKALNPQAKTTPNDNQEQLANQMLMSLLQNEFGMDPATDITLQGTSNNNLANQSVFSNGQYDNQLSSNPFAVNSPESGLAYSSILNSNNSLSGNNPYDSTIVKTVQPKTPKAVKPL